MLRITSLLNPVRLIWLRPTVELLLSDTNKHLVTASHPDGQDVLTQLSQQPYEQECLTTGLRLSFC